MTPDVYVAALLILSLAAIIIVIMTRNGRKPAPPGRTARQDHTERRLSPSRAERR